MINCAKLSDQVWPEQQNKLCTWEILA